MTVMPFPHPAPRRPGWPIAQNAAQAPRIVPGAVQAAMVLRDHPDAPAAVALNLARITSPATALRILRAALTEAEVLASGPHHG